MDQKLAMSWQAMVHEKVLLPLLPPPVISGIHKLDPLLEPYVGGPNGCITLLSSLVLAWFLVWFLVKNVTSTSSGKAVIDEAQVQLTSQLLRDDASSTVLLTGSRKSGKTRLFCYLVYNNHKQVTVMSLQSNVAIVDDMRVIDWPGSRPFEPAVTELIVQRKKHSLRIVLMVDATQPARAAAEALWQLLPHLQRKGGEAMAVLIACHKQDLPKARNEKRLRIQLRNELERLRGKEEPVWWPESASSYEELSFCQLTFHPTTLESTKGAAELAEWCRTGAFPPK